VARAGTLPTTTLGRSGLEISRVGFGAWALGGGGAWGWGPQDDEESVAAIHRAVELGLDWIDTAPAYGGGRSEHVVGRALAGLSEPPLVFTKCSRIRQPDGTSKGVLKRDSIRREAEESLERLGIERIDLYQIHAPEPDPDIEEGWRTLAELKEEGLVRAIGVSNFDVAQLRRAEAIAPVETLQPSYSLIDRDVESEILTYCREQDIGVIVYSPMGSGLLTGRFTRERAESLPDDDWRSRASEFQEPELSRNLELVERLRAVGERHGVPPGAVAIAWTLRHPAVHGAIVGFRRPEQVEELAGAAAVDLGDDELAEIEGS